MKPKGKKFKSTDDKHPKKINSDSPEKKVNTFFLQVVKLPRNLSWFVQPKYQVFFFGHINVCKRIQNNKDLRIQNSRYQTVREASIYMNRVSTYFKYNII